MKTLKFINVVRSAVIFIGCLIIINIGNQVSAQDGFGDPNIDLRVFELILQPDGKILIGGDFSNVGGQPRSRAARLNADGTLDISFQNPNVAGDFGNVHVYALQRQDDGKVLIGGFFKTVGGQARNNLARLNTDGSLDMSFMPEVNGAITTIAVQIDGKILVGGLFTSVNGQTRNRLARLNTDGILDTSFQDPNVSQNPNINTSVNTLAVQTDGKILIGGNFNLVGGHSHPYLARLNADGSLDTSFNVNINRSVEQIVIQPDGKILIGGFFSSVNGIIRNSAARINADGSLDQSFQNPNITSGYVSALALQTDGKIIVGGEFSSIAGRERDDLARLNADGTFDSSFQDPNANFGGTFYSIYSIVVQPDGKVLIGGDFTTIGRQTRKMVVRLLSDGTLDAPSQTLTVTKTADSDDGVCDADCSLREAITAANGNVESSLINFDSQVFGNPQTITLTSGELIIAANRRVIISGTQAGNLTVSGNNSSRIMRISRDANVSISGLTIIGGNGVGGGFSGEGGAVYIEPNGVATQLTLTNTIFTNNQAAVGGAIRTSGTSIVSINNSTISQNTASYTPGGGGIYFDNGTLDITNSVISGNQATFQAGSGGGIAIGNGSAVFNLTDSIVTGNTAINTGGISAGGTTRILNSTISNNRASSLAGGVYSSGNVSVIDSTISDNKVTNSDGMGGGIFNFGRLTVMNSEVVNNSAAFGGGFFTYGGLSLTKTDITNNTSAKSGAGIYNNSGGTTSLPVTVNYSVINKNKAEEAGGGIYNRDVFNLNFTTVQSNSANIGGGGIFNVFLNTGAAIFTAANSTISENRSNSAGGGISNQTGTINLTNSTVSSNNSFGLGSGINNNLNGTVNLNHATIAFNTASAGTGKGINSGSGGVNAKNTIIARNVSGSALTFSDFGGTLNSQGYNLIGNTTGATISGTTTGNILDKNPRLARLTDNGGATRTHALFLNSPAIDAGNDGGTAIDQRGKQRPFDFSSINNVADGSDIGAFERQNDDVANNAIFDFDGDGRSDISVFRPSAGAWYVQQSTSGFTGLTFGASTDLPAPADFDGDGKTDVAVFRPSNGAWYYLRSSDGVFVGVTFGQNGDIPIPGDFDGDGKADISVFRPSNGAWYRLNSSNGSFAGVSFGQNGDKPLLADFDGDGKNDIAVFRPNAGTFYWLESSSGEFRAIAFGISTDIPTMGDFDGDGKTDISVFRPSNGAWYRYNSSNGAFVGVSFGQAGDVPAAADYDGDGKADIAVFRNGVWYYLQSSNGTFVGLSFGLGTDKPIPASFQ